MGNPGRGLQEQELAASLRGLGKDQQPSRMIPAGLWGAGQAGGCGDEGWKEAGSRKLRGAGGCRVQGLPAAGSWGGGKGLAHPSAARAA